MKRNIQLLLAAVLAFSGSSRAITHQKGNANIALPATNKDEDDEPAWKKKKYYSVEVRDALQKAKGGTMPFNVLISNDTKFIADYIIVRVSYVGSTGRDCDAQIYQVFSLEGNKSIAFKGDEDECSVEVQTDIVGVRSDALGIRWGEEPADDFTTLNADDK